MATLMMTPTMIRTNGPVNVVTSTLRGLSTYNAEFTSATNRSVAVTFQHWPRSVNQRRPSAYSDSHTDDTLHSMSRLCVTSSEKLENIRTHLPAPWVTHESAACPLHPCLLARQVLIGRQLSSLARPDF